MYIHKVWSKAKFFCSKLIRNIIDSFAGVNKRCLYIYEPYSTDFAVSHYVTPIFQDPNVSLRIYLSSGFFKGLLPYAVLKKIDFFNAVSDNIS